MYELMQDLGHSFSQYRPPGWQITYTYLWFYYCVGFLYQEPKRWLPYFVLQHLDVKFLAGCYVFSQSFLETDVIHLKLQVFEGTVT